MTIAVGRSNPAPPRTVMRGVAEAGVVLTDLSLRLIAMDGGAASILFAAQEGNRNGAKSSLTLPVEILKAMRNSCLNDLSSLNLRFHAGNLRYTARAYLVEPHDGVLSQRTVLLHLERESVMGDALVDAGLVYHLTERERAALQGVAIGLTSKELALRMNIRPNTVKALLRLVMIKMGAPNRAGIVAKILTTPHPDNGVPEVRPELPGAIAV